MYALTLLVAAISIVAAAPSVDVEARQAVQVASVDRYAGSGCTGTICNIAGSGDLFTGCNKVTDACKASLRLSGLKPGCKVTIWSDETCSSVRQFANVTSYDCYALGPPIKSISVTC
ncbi:hypothetical protein HBI56_130920 [Parastagonospora nodorum]|uniref:Uncharacterized protein n=1 Tax=Phaeosphaeria nodorum (strain SN15 / ATCC MYA-4574 / FGSC 10173) TaxID=321614 RepID=A0A7U2F3V1_PHANO|nr:hypothetical protein HBH56_152900 [Parastagonospora nodorum]QRC96049.1 hypothetical protein JI435_056880 [Parastagonospora nodorum SN15]KAH3926552.1 hypothetical protein HBH54_164790 [Parastagonospora nodorum]KAH3940394.1 hypothetical protein HBH53_217730 [Parastagonospora nodorum]KAH3970468.1 hypothetical protein HBH52_166100 [Parastagonospora nodorum]